MLNSQFRSPSVQESALRAALRELRDEAITVTIPGLYVAGICLVLFVDVFQTTLQGALPGMLLLGLALLIGILRRYTYWLAAWTLFIGMSLVAGILIVWTGVPTAVSLLALPAGLATLFIGLVAGIGGAVVATVAIILAPAELVPLDTTARFMALFQIWGAVWLVWLTSRSLLTAMMWFQSSYEQSRALLEEARDRQLRLQQTLDDLAEANLQLSRLHRLANSMRQLAEEARHTKEQFVANVSHELRTPLNMIIGFTEMIMQSPQTYGSNIPQSLLADLEIVWRNSRHLSGLIDDVLDLSHVETGHMALTKEKVDLAEIVYAAVSAVQPLYQSKHLDLQTSIPADLPLLFCDPIRVRQVLLNLLSNAGRFTEYGGVQVTVQQDERFVTISVADTGPGIAGDDIDKLFQPFQQLDSSIRRRHGGSGLGLSISKEFVELHGGKMWVETRQGHGTTFYFRLPLEPPVAAHTETATRWLMPHNPYQERTHRSLAPIPVRMARIVVLESGHTLQRMVARYLDNAQVIPVTTAEAALHELATQPCHALLVNDMAVSERLPEWERAELPYGTPVIVCTVPGALESADKLGVADYLIKPVSSEHLLHTLQQVCPEGNVVLVVDDDRDALRLFRRMLSVADRSYRVLRAGNGRQALRILERERPDVVLLDLIMPELDGFGFLAAKNQDPELERIPVIVLSAQDPMGQPIVCKSIAVTRGGGISIRRLLASIETLTYVLAPQQTELRVEHAEEGVTPDRLADEGVSA